MSDVLRSNVSDFTPAPPAAVGADRLGLLASALGALTAIAGAYLPW